jgi:Holliday junction resolvase RusA-like endonuclease
LGGEVMSYKFTLPLYGVTKKGAISMNWYRNAHYQSTNSAKKKFKKLIKSQLNQFDEIQTPIKVKYTYYAQRNNNPDLDNFTAIVRKFFQDALVEHGLIEDDNVKFIIANSDSYGGIDKDNPRVEAEVIEV